MYEIKPKHLSLETRATCKAEMPKNQGKKYCAAVSFICIDFEPEPGWFFVNFRVPTHMKCTDLCCIILTLIVLYGVYYFQYNMN